MKTIEEKIREFARKLTPCGICHRKGCRVEIEDCAWYKDIYKALSEVAKLQKEIDEEVRLKKCDDITQAEYNRETAFVDWYLENGKGMPAYYDAIEWARKDLLDKAWSLAYSMYQAGRDNLIHLTKDEFIKAMEE